VDTMSLLRRFRALLPRDRALLWVLCLSIGAGVSRCGYDISFAEIQVSFAER